MKYDDENWIKVYTRDTAGWLALSWQARGLMLEIARRLPKHSGELSLGRRGLEAIAALVRAPWAEIEPFISELIDDGRLEYDAEQKIIRDPQHADRQNAVASGAARTRKWRETRPDTVTTSDAPVTTCDAARPIEEKEKKEEKEKSERAHARDGLVRIDLPLEDDARKIWDARTMTRDPGQPIADVWANFCGHYATQEFGSRQGILGKWQKWIGQQCEFHDRTRQAEYDRKNAIARRRDGPEPPPKPTPEQSKRFAAELVARVQAGRKGAA